MPWTKLGEGSYNTTYLSADGTTVLKIQKASRTKDKVEKEYDAPYRSARLWNELNPSVSKASVLESELGIGWVCPYIAGDQASDEEISGALINIFNRTGRVVVDSTIPRNFLRTSKGEIVCVDIAQALRMEQLEISYLQQRRKSLTSLSAWQELQSKYRTLFSEDSYTFPAATNTIKALLFIKFNRPDILDVSFLNHNIDLVQQLAKAFDQIEVPAAIKHLYIVASDGSEEVHRLPFKQFKRRTSTSHIKGAWMAKAASDEHDEKPRAQKESENLVMRAHASLQVEVPISLEHIKTSCAATLVHYIKSLGSFDSQGAFKHSFFRNPESTSYKVLKTLDLIFSIHEAKSINEIQESIISTKNSITPKRHSTLQTELDKCLLIIEKVSGEEVPESYTRTLS